MTKYFIFYKTTYTKDGRYYFGSHYGELADCYRGSNKVIKSIQKIHGNTFLIRENLRLFSTQEECYAFEDRFLKLYNLAVDPKSLNFKNSANGGNTWGHMTEAEKTIRKEKISIGNKGAKNVNYGKPMPASRKEKMVRTKTGVSIHSDEHKKKNF